MIFLLFATHFSAHPAFCKVADIRVVHDRFRNQELLASLRRNRSRTSTRRRIFCRAARDQEPMCYVKITRLISGMGRQVIAWPAWKAKLPPPNSSNKPQWAPNDVMLQLFEQLGEQPTQADMRYVLALLLIRRRLLKLEESVRDEHGIEQLTLYCPRNELQYHIPAILLEDGRIVEIQNELAKLLFSTPE